MKIQFLKDEIVKMLDQCSPEQLEKLKKLLTALLENSDDNETNELLTRYF